MHLLNLLSDSYCTGNVFGTMGNNSYCAIHMANFIERNYGTEVQFTVKLDKLKLLSASLEFLLAFHYIVRLCALVHSFNVIIQIYTIVTCLKSVMTMLIYILSNYMAQLTVQINFYTLLHIINQAFLFKSFALKHVISHYTMSSDSIHPLVIIIFWGILSLSGFKVWLQSSKTVITRECIF